MSMNCYKLTKCQYYKTNVHKLLQNSKVSTKGMIAKVIIEKLILAWLELEQATFDPFSQQKLLL